jgi:amino acid transporter
LTPAARSGPRASLRDRDAVGIIVGIVIGAGIYRTPALVADVTGDAGWTLVMWLAGAVISFIGALCYAELASAYPHAGGDYHFLTRAFGRDVSFLYGWARATVINPGSIALLAFVFGDYVSRLFSRCAFGSDLGRAAGGRTDARQRGEPACVDAHAELADHRRSVRRSRRLRRGHGRDAGNAGSDTVVRDEPAPGMLGLALVFVLLTYGGWNEAAYISAELAAAVRPSCARCW